MKRAIVLLLALSFLTIAAYAVDPWFPPPCISGTVYLAPGMTGVEDITVTLFDSYMNPFKITTTDFDGIYEFWMLYPGDYTVSIEVPPDHTVDQNDVPVELIYCQPVIVDFVLSTDSIPPPPPPPPPFGYAGSTGYWGSQINGKGNNDYTFEEVEEFAQIAYDMYYMHSDPLHQIRVEGANHTAGFPMTIEEMQETMNIKGNAGMYAKALKQYLAVFMNIAAGHLDQTVYVSNDYATASQAIYYVNELLGYDDDLAKDIAEYLNVGNMIEAGVIPLDTPNIIYSDNVYSALAANTFKFHAAYPNPFNPDTKLSFTMNEPANISLVIYDILGKEVLRLAEGLQSAGVHNFVFDASELATGVYFAQLVAGNQISTQRLILVR